MTDQVSAVALCGSLRRDSFNAALMRSLPDLAPPGLAIAPQPPLHGFPVFDNDIRESEGIPAMVVELGARIRAADAVIIVTPEYNYSVPGGLKNVIDWLSRLPDPPFKDKPVAIQSAATGQMGGIRAQNHLRHVLVFLDAVAFTRPEVIVTFAKDKFADGRLAHEPTRETVRQQLAAFESFVRKVTSKLTF